MFVEFINTSERLLSNYGLRSDDITNMYKNVKDYIINERHVQFGGEDGIGKKDVCEQFKSLSRLPIISANDSSLAITGAYIFMICNSLNF